MLASLVNIDRVCINQKDVNERGHQVGMMRDVYSKATEVLIWLGGSSKKLGMSEPATEVLDSTSCPWLSSGATLEYERNPGKNYGEEGTPSSARGFIPVSDLFFDYLDRMFAEFRALGSAAKDPESSPLYQKLSSQIYESSLGGVKTDLCHGFEDVLNRRW